MKGRHEQDKPDKLNNKKAGIGFFYQPKKDTLC